MGWPLSSKDLKWYPHFDAVFSLADLVAYATDPEAVRKHAFFPFLRYNKSWQPFRGSAKKPGKKRRPIRYACRRDSAIFSYYRFQLSKLYEAELTKRGLADCPIAYRKILASNGRGKCNIDFAFEAFDTIRRLGPCCAVALDISQYFESLDHVVLREHWKKLLGANRLPPDHAAVFKAITRYSEVDRNDVYIALGIIGPKAGPNGEPSFGYLKDRRSMPHQLCSAADFRRVVAAKDNNGHSLIKKNAHAFGIPQGAPLSDLLANIYLLDFDQEMNDFARGVGGRYVRYSDDILLIIPGGEADGKAAAGRVGAAIRKCGAELQIKESKTAVVSFTPDSQGLLRSTRHDRTSYRGGLDYLGFRFDGARVFIRESTMSRLFRNIRRAARNRARVLARRYHGKDVAYLLDQFNLRDFDSRFGRVEAFGRGVSTRKWTFRTYTKRAAETFGPAGLTFYRQLRNYRKKICSVAREEIERAIRETAG